MPNSAIRSVHGGFASVGALLLIGVVISGTAYALRYLHQGQTLGLAAGTALFFAVVTPATIIAIRHQVRRERVKQIELFAESFDFGTSDTKAASSNTGSIPNASFEFVRAKYFADLDTRESYGRRSVDDIPRFPMMLQADWMLLLCAVPYMILVGFGLFLLFVPVSAFAPADGALSDVYLPSLMAVGGIELLSVEDVHALHINVLTVTAFAFGGAYLFTLRLFLRAVTVFDLSAVTFLRAFVHILINVATVVVLYRFIPSSADIAAAIPGLTLPAAASTSSKALETVWLILAFAMGFIPDSALSQVLRKARLTHKSRYTAVEPHAPVVPLTIIDGIDLYTAFRLEESNIHDVQNLSAYNPIMLHIEGPFGFYQTTDWVAQAQLCTIVGPERFLLLRSFNIRTVFDLKVAVLHLQAPPDIVARIGQIIVKDTRRDSLMRLAMFGAPSGTAEDPSADAGLSADAIRHMVTVMIDDLHVHRLGQIWARVKSRLNGIEVGETTPDLTPATTNPPGLAVAAE